MMKSLYEELGGTYTLGDDGMLYPDLAIGDKDSRPIGKWGRMHMKYLEAEHPGLYERLILKGTLNRHLADANERAIRMLERLIVQMAAQEGITESLKKAQSLEWVRVPSSIMRKFVYKSGRTKSAQGREPALDYPIAEGRERVKGGEALNVSSVFCYQPAMSSCISR